jgi:glycosyl transferase family 25
MEFRRFVINLETRADRRQQMEAQLRRIGWTAEFIIAKRPDAAAGFPSIGARGCFESHIAVLRRGIGSNIILMEDDLNFVSDFDQAWPLALSRLPVDWSIFYPAHVGNGLIDPETGIMCSHMIAFRKTAVPRIIQNLETIMSRPSGHPEGGPMHVDGAYSTIRKQNTDLRTYAFSPALGYQRSSLSDIANPKILDRMPVLKPFMRLARRALNR